MEFTQEGFQKRAMTKLGTLFGANLRYTGNPEDNVYNEGLAKGIEIGTQLVADVLKEMEAEQAAVKEINLKKRLDEIYGKEKTKSLKQILKAIEKEWSDD